MERKLECEQIEVERVGFAYVLTALLQIRQGRLRNICLLFTYGHLAESSLFFFFFWSSSKFTAKLNTRYGDLLCISFPSFAQLPTSLTSLPEWYIFTVNEPTQRHHYHPNSMVSIRVHSWYCTFYGFRQMYSDARLSSENHTEQFHRPKILCAAYFPFPPHSPL